MTSSEAQLKLVTILPRERERLYRLCTYLTGSPDAADDIVQETCIEAWRQVERVYDWEGVGAWLSAIARNLSARWLRHQARASQRLQPLAQEPTLDAANTCSAGDRAHVDGELERAELATLLDEAMARLPPELRHVLLARYRSDASYVEMARHAGISESLVAVRLHRGKHALRRILTNEFAEETASYGYATPLGAWRETRIWCPFCGQRKLEMGLDAASDRCTFQCPACLDGDSLQICSTAHNGLLTGLKSPKAILSRQLRWLDGYYRHGLAAHQFDCVYCRRLLPVKIHAGETSPTIFSQSSGVHICCPQCGLLDSIPLPHLSLDLAAVQQFWRANPRMHVVPGAQVERDGRATTVTTFASLTSTAQVDVLSDSVTLEVLSIHD